MPTRQEIEDLEHRLAIAKASPTEKTVEMLLEDERKEQIAQEFALRTPDYKPCGENAGKMWQAMHNADGSLKEWTVENLTATYAQLAREGQLLPQPQRIAATPVPKTLLEQAAEHGITVQSLARMPKAEYKAKLANPYYSQLINAVIAEHNQRGGN